MYATFVIPAPNGCNLSCSYCAVALRNEARENVLTDNQYLWFLEETLRFPELKGVSIVGFEPMLDGSVGLAEEMLKRTTFERVKDQPRHISASFNTNGVNLPKHIEHLSVFTDKIMISLDSDHPDINDRMRGVKGTFSRTIEGIQCAVDWMRASQSVIVNTLLLPNKTERVKNIPKLLASLGVKTWVISPYINFREGELRPKIDYIRKAVYELAREAELVGIKAFYADEFRKIGEITGIQVFNFQRPGNPDEFVFRLSPNGSCSVGDEILADSGNAEVWDGKQSPRDFLLGLRPTS